MSTDLPNWAKLPVEVRRFAKRAIVLSPAIQGHIEAYGWDGEEWEELQKLLEERRKYDDGSPSSRNNRRLYG